MKTVSILIAVLFCINASAQNTSCRNLIGMSTDSVQYFIHEIEAYTKGKFDTLQRYYADDATRMYCTDKANKLRFRFLSKNGKVAELKLIVMDDKDKSFPAFKKLYTDLIKPMIKPCGIVTFEGETVLRLKTVQAVLDQNDQYNAILIY